MPQAQMIGGVMDYANGIFGATLATLTPDELEELGFEVIPRKFSVEASEAPAIIQEIRAFYAFAWREGGLKAAEECLDLLSGDAAERLEKALSDPSKFGMAKSLFMAGGAAGFDMKSKEGLEAWMRSIEGKPLPPSIRLPGIDVPPGPRKDPSAARAKKNKRKAASSARRKNKKR